MKIHNRKNEAGSQKPGARILLTWGCLLYSGFCLLSPRLYAQSNSAPTFFQSLGGYLTSINTNYTFEANSLEVSLGAGQSGPILANYVGAQYDLGRWDLAAQVRNAGITGVIQSAELGGGYSVIQSGDTKLQLGLLAGYDWSKSAALFEPQLVLRKKATRNTFFEAGVSLPEWSRGPLNKTPAFFVGTGFTY